MTDHPDAHPTPLWQLAPAYAALLEELLAREGDITDTDIAEAIEQARADIAERVAACKFVSLRAEAEGNADLAFCKPWLERAKRKLAIAEGVKAYALRCLTTAGISKVSDGQNGARLQKNSQPSITFTGEVSALPDELKRITVEFDKEALKRLSAVKGYTLPPGVTVETHSHLRWT